MSGTSDSELFRGSWGDFASWTHWLQDGGYVRNAQDHLRDVGNAVRSLIRGHIASQDMGWKELSGLTVLQKGHGLVYIETNKYSRRIRVTSLRRKYGATVHIAPGNHVYTRSGKTAAEVAFLNEYGGPKLPARPIWRPVFMEMQALPEIADIPLAEILEVGQWAH